MRIRHSITTVSSLSLMLALAGTVGAASAQAAQPASNGGAAQVAAVVQRATGTTGIAHTTAGADGAQAQVAGSGGNVVVTVPSTAGGKIAVTAPNGTAVTLSMPATSNTAGVTTSTGTTVYPDAAQGADLAVQATTDGGARALVTLKDASAANEQRFNLGLPAGVRLVAAGGGYDLVQSVGDGGSLVLGHIDAPWAKDATGKSLATTYRLDGTTLVQTVETDKNTAYPVVADPKWTWGYISGTVYFNKHDTGHVAADSAFVAVAFAAAPPPFDVYGILNSANISRVAWNAQNDNKCVEVKVPTFQAYEYSGGYCS
ncbi:hypothetical protein ACIGXM_03520 [Kitasatospora sp. NPDC052896]|uniref:hypothetical protein n=1 Tax=Kitasatospora sp. NPDC052896 TaxID=3364061 RepID=UPI0037C5F552